VARRSMATTSPDIRGARTPMRIDWRARRLWRLELAALCLLGAGAFVGFLIYPTYPNYDSLYSLLWGHDLDGGDLPSFDAYRAPTQHPLWVALGVLLDPFGTSADRVMLGITVASFVALVAGVYRLGKVGLVAAALLLTRLDLPFFAARGYVDVPYLALVVWAGALEAAKPRRGGLVWVLLAMAGLLRPETWLLIGVYALWWAWGGPIGRWVRAAAWSAIAPGIWFLSDAMVTGDPLYSLHYTTRSAELLGRRNSVIELPEITVRFLVHLTKWPVLVAGAVGVVVAYRLVGRRIVVPAALLVAGVSSFLLVSIRGFSVINRYLLLAVVMLLLFAAVGLTGFALLRAGHRARLPWAVASAVLVVAGAVWTLANFNPRYVDDELTLRESVRKDLTRVLNSPEVTAARRCGPVSVPNHKLIADARWVMRAPPDAVVARTDPAQAARARRGAALFVTGGMRFLRHPAYGPFDQDEDSALIQVPGPGFSRAVVGRRFSAYVRC
jgi:hypothetical protein